MISTPDRQLAVSLIDKARTAPRQARGPLGLD